MTPIPTVIDLYHGDIVTSFKQLKEAGIERVIHKATEGVTEVDPAYASRMPEALAAGLQWEAYLFWHPDDPEEMADHFLSAAAPASGYWLDYEVAGGSPSSIIAVMQAVNGGIQGTMGLYTTKSLAEHLAENSTGEQADFFATCPLWLAEPGVPKPVLSKPASLIWPKISLWQYTFHGTIAGVKNRCDLNCIPA